MKRLTTTVAFLLVLLATPTAALAQDENLKIHYNFENVDNKTVPDQSGNGIDAKLMNQASVTEMGKFHVLDLGNGTGYLDMTTKAGAIVKELNDFTVSVYYFVNEDASLSGAGYFLWCFSQSAANTQTASPYTAYRLNAQRMATSTNGWGNEVGMEMGQESEKGRWIHMLYRQAGRRGDLFLDGTQVQTLATMPVLSSTFTAAPAYNWIGRAPFSSDNYLKNTLVADFRLYDKALTNNEVAELAEVSQQLDYEYKYGQPGDFTQLEQQLQTCKDFIAIAGSDYLPNALAELQDEINLAENQLEAHRISQSLIDARVDLLKQALAQAQKSNSVDMFQVSTPSSGDHGFVHPGGLHTQADFDRIKQLLTDGDPTITAAFNALKAGEYAQPGIATWPTETVWRSGSGDNYMNAARGGAMAYQNALVWKIAGTTANADAAVRILMQWARQNKYVSGNTNLSLAAGLYGYAFAQAAELVRDYEGWSREDFDEFKRYIMTTWYPPTIDFLRRRHDTWLNAGGGSNGQRPGHYWSNWGLCCTMAMISYGILLDDVHMYNEGLSFFKYDHVGNFPADQCVNRTEEVQNWGLTEFLGNLVPVVYDDERGPYGQLGQMQESGRDCGHEQMAAGLAVDIAQVAYNQGDDLFAYMDHRLIAGLEFVAAHDFGNLSNLPWTNYRYCDCRTAWHNGWVMTGCGNEAHWRPYWDRIVGHYQGVKGVKVPYSEMAAKALRGTDGYDMGGHSYGETSGGYDHLGFSTLTCYRPEMADPEKAPLELNGQIVYKGQTLNQTDLGGLKYNYEATSTRAIPADGSSITLIPVLPAGVTDNGSWQWNTGETSREITVSADHSYIYRVCYTTDAGTPSYRNFSIAVAGDCTPNVLHPEITVDGVIYQTTEMAVSYGKSVILYTGNNGGWTNDYRWDNGATGNSVIVIPNITTSRDYTCHYRDQGGFVGEQVFHLTVIPVEQFITVDGVKENTSEMIVTQGKDALLSLNVPSTVIDDQIQWSNGQTGISIHVDDIQTSQTFTATFLHDGQTITCTFNLYVKMANDPLIQPGDYYIKDIASGRYLTNPGDGNPPYFTQKDDSQPDTQIWNIIRPERARYDFISKLDNAYLFRTGDMRSDVASLYRMRIEGAEGTDCIAIYGNGTPRSYWATNADGSINFSAYETLTAFPYVLEPVDGETSIDNMQQSMTPVAYVEYYTTDGRHISQPLVGGISLQRIIHTDGNVTVRKVMIPN